MKTRQDVRRKSLFSLCMFVRSVSLVLETKRESANSFVDKLSPIDLERKRGGKKKE